MSNRTRKSAQTSVVSTGSPQVKQPGPLPSLALAAQLYRIEPGQNMSNLDRECRAIIQKAIDGDVAACELIFDLLEQQQLKIESRAPTITSDMTPAEASRAYEATLREKPEWADDESNDKPLMANRTSKFAQRFLSRTLAAQLYQVERGQIASNLERMCQALIRRANAGNVAAFNLITQRIKKLKRDQRRSAMEYASPEARAEAVRLFLDSCGSTDEDEEDES